MQKLDLQLMLYLVLLIKFMCLFLSSPSSHCKTARVSGTAAALPSTAYPSHKHSSSQPQPQPPSYQAQLNTTGKCETLYILECV